MRYHDHGHTILCQLFHNIQNFSYHFRVKCRCRLIKQHNFRLHCQCPHDRNTLLLSTGKLDRICICTVSKSDTSQELKCFFLCFFSGNTFDLHRCQCHILKDRHMRKQVKMLENHSHFLTEAVDVQLYFLSGSIDIFFLRDVHAIENDLAVCRFFQKVQTAKESRFTGTGRSDHYHYITSVDIRCYTVQCFDRTSVIMFLEVSYLNQTIACRHGSFSFRNMQSVWRSGSTGRNKLLLLPAAAQ